MKSYFTTGIAVLLPLVLTLMALEVAVDFLTHPFLAPAKRWVEYLPCLPYFGRLCQLPLFIEFSSRMLILFLLSSIVFLVGWLGNLFIVESFFRLGEKILRRIPVINKIYTASKEVVQRLLVPTTPTPSQVVMAPYPTEQNQSLAFMVPQAIRMAALPNAIHEPLYSVFVPGAPNPTFGLLLIFKKEQLTPIDMTAEEAVKLLVACGVTTPRPSHTNIGDPIH